MTTIVMTFNFKVHYLINYLYRYIFCYEISYLEFYRFKDPFFFYFKEEKLHLYQALLDVCLDTIFKVNSTVLFLIISMAAVPFHYSTCML